MSGNKFDRRFFESTRGRLVLLLRTSAKTVNELAAALKLTDNGVRAHLLSLERDQLVEPAGTIKGFRKPHLLYRLTDNARHVFPKSYDSLLNRLLDVLKTKIPRMSLESILTEVGRTIGADRGRAAKPDFDQRVGSALLALEELGGAAIVQNVNGSVIIKSESCPFADAVVEHPEICHVAESMIAEIVGAHVQETCDRTALPKCRFAIEKAA